MSTSTTHQQSLADAGSETRPPMLERAEIEAMNLILISIPNDIYNSVDACTTTQVMWKGVERLMRGTVQNKAEGKHVSIMSLINLLLNWEKHLSKKLEKSHVPLALVAHMGSSSKTTSPYYVTHPSSVVDYDVDYQEDAVQNTFKDPLTSAMILLARVITQHYSNLTNNRLRTSSNTRNQAIVQAEKVHIQSRNSGNDGRNIRCSYELLQKTAANVQCYNCSEKGHYAHNFPKPRVRDSKYFMEQMLFAKQDEAGVILTDEHNNFLFADASRMEEIEELSANICLMAKIQPTNFDSDERPSYDFAFLSEVQTPSTSYVNPLFSKDK
ncbi:hypothetical protein Tco_0995766 [Tanacetum coccineum]